MSKFQVTVLKSYEEYETVEVNASTFNFEEGMLVFYDGPGHKVAAFYRWERVVEV